MVLLMHFDLAATALRKAQVFAKEILTTECDMRNATPYLYQIEGDKWLSNHELGEEVFGPLGIIVTVRDFDEMLLAVARSLQGQLTCTLHMDDTDVMQAQKLYQYWNEKQDEFWPMVFPLELRSVMPWCMVGLIPLQPTLVIHLLAHCPIRRFLRPVSAKTFPMHYCQSS